MTGTAVTVLGAGVVYMQPGDTLQVHGTTGGLPGPAREITVEPVEVPAAPPVPEPEPAKADPVAPEQEPVPA